MPHVAPNKKAMNAYRSAHGKTRGPPTVKKAGDLRIALHML